MKSKLLIVDDEKNMRWAIHRALEKEGYDIFEASNGKEGVEAFEKNQPDVVLLDLKMPVMDGMEALKKNSRNKFNHPGPNADSSWNHGNSH